MRGASYNCLPITTNLEAHGSTACGLSGGKAIGPARQAKVRLTTSAKARVAKKPDATTDLGHYE